MTPPLNICPNCGSHEIVKEVREIDYYDPQTFNGHGQHEVEGFVCESCDHVLDEEELQLFAEEKGYDLSELEDWLENFWAGKRSIATNYN